MNFVRINKTKSERKIFKSPKILKAQKR